ncbi:recombinase family protein [Synechococcales cyanobacterium C]|uniref:Recombinase family protein n=1 Tax=Petrachloros mirabilis ULC683 TaxID=2781853 RepID=A0A8K2A1H3_9CYAN|nr:recombinase family protein [Petrachloros mirabilis ULC683]
MPNQPLWITGPVRSGKTQALVEAIVQNAKQQVSHARIPPTPIFLGFAVNGDNRVQLLDRIVTRLPRAVSVQTTTPLAFFESEVILYWPLLLKLFPEGQLLAQFPLRLRPETEQFWATALWDSTMIEELNSVERLPAERWIRRVLDVGQLAAFGGIPLEALPERFAEGFAPVHQHPETWDLLVRLLEQWRQWCWAQGLLTYGLLTELYGQHLLPHPQYQAQLCQRFQGIFADDVDSYPAIARTLFEHLLVAGLTGAFTYNPEGAIRLGLGADPQALTHLSQRCEQVPLPEPRHQHLAPQILIDVAAQVTPLEPFPGSALQRITTYSRAQLLRQVAETIVQAVRVGQVQPQDIAIIGPGLDTLARYTLIDILTQRGIAVSSLKDQRPLVSTALVRALLTLLALVYPGLGRWVNVEQIAEMLVVLTLPPPRSETVLIRESPIDPVRAGLLADHCFRPHPEHPELLPITAFPRWDRLGYGVATAYDKLRDWVTQQRSALTPASYLTLSPVFVLDRAIQHFCAPVWLSDDQLAALRELIETAQHFWVVQDRLGSTNLGESVGQLIQLLRQGTLTANPFPLQSSSTPHPAVMIATTFQYRTARLNHRWHFWLDVGSPLWQGGGAVELWGAPLLMQQAGQPQTASLILERDQAQLQRLIHDLLRRVQERAYLCHSTLSVGGQEQVGPLLPLLDAAVDADLAVGLHWEKKL